MQKATALLEDGWVLFALAQCKAAQHFQSFPSISGETSPSNFLHSFISQFNNSFVPTAGDTLADNDRPWPPLSQT